MTTSTTTTHWDISALPATASTTPTLSKRRGQQYQRSLEAGRTKPHSREQSDTPFPRQSSSSESLHDDHGSAPTQRTVRRKKSSFDLRHVFKNGGVVPAPAAHAVSML